MGAGPGPGGHRSAAMDGWMYVWMDGWMDRDGGIARFLGFLPLPPPPPRSSPPPHGPLGGPKEGTRTDLTSIPTNGQEVS